MEDVPGPKEKCPPYEFCKFQRHTPKSRWLMAQRVFHGLDQITPELKEVMYACTNCLMCQELCGVRGDGYGPVYGVCAKRYRKDGRFRRINRSTLDYSSMIILGPSQGLSAARGPRVWE